MMDRDEFLEAAQQPAYGDVMSFEIIRRDPDPTKSFSREALDDVAEKMLAFIVSRVMAQWFATGAAPHELHLDLRCRWSQSNDLEQMPFPWYKLADDAPDGTHRKRP